MPLSFHPGPGIIVICDYSSGFQAPEMVKVRPVVVISPRRRSSQLVTVVPISSTPPTSPEPWHYLLPPGAYPPAHGSVWVKCDMLATVGLKRLDRVKIHNRQGPPSWTTFEISEANLTAVMAGVKAALGIS